MRRGPVILGYYEPAVSGNHVVVAYGASATHVAVMNPDGGHNPDHPWRAEHLEVNSRL